MDKTYRPYQPHQVYLLPPSLDEWLPEDHLARFVGDVVDQLDLSPVFAHYEQSNQGYPPYHPGMMTRVLVYAYCTGVYSSRKIAARLHDDVAFRYLAAGNFPDFRTISTFRKRHLKDFERLFAEILRLCREAGLVKLGTIAIDGTKVRANASIHKAMSYGRMKKETKRLEAEVTELLKRAEAVDAEEDRRFGDRRGDELPEELAIRQNRLKRIQEAKAALEAEAHKAADDDDDDDPPPIDDKTQRNFTDPDSRVMKGPGRSFVQAYNAQIAVDAESQVIVAKRIHETSADVTAFTAVLDETMNRVGTPQRVVADAGYYSNENVAAARRRKTAPFIPPQKVRHGEWRRPGPRGPLPKDATPRERMVRFMQTRRGKDVYRLRQTSVEPVFGQIKAARGFARFSLRGRDAVTGEWNLVTAVHNLLKLFRHRQAAAMS